MSARIANYAEHVTLRKECGQKFGAIHELKLIKPNRLIQKILETSSEGVLDFGSGVDHHHKSEYQIPDDRYFSLDSDSSGAFDYRSLEEIPFGQKFDLVIMNQVIEHIQFDDCVEVIALKLMQKRYREITSPTRSHDVLLTVQVSTI